MFICGKPGDYMKSCLIVDDSGVIRKIIRNILEDLKVKCDEAADGQLAYDACVKSMPDFIMLDWNMPVMNGLDFLKKLRQSPGGDKPVVIFCTTENDMAHIQMALEAGANDFIMKPFERDILQSKLEMAGVLS